MVKTGLFFQGWWLVDHDGELGWAPASHLEPVDDGSEVTTSKTFAPGQGKLAHVFIDVLSAIMKPLLRGKRSSNLSWEAW